MPYAFWSRPIIQVTGQGRFPQSQLYSLLWLILQHSLWLSEVQLIHWPSQHYMRAIRNSHPITKGIIQAIWPIGLTENKWLAEDSYNSSGLNPYSLHFSWLSCNYVQKLTEFSICSGGFPNDIYLNKLATKFTNCTRPVIWTVNGWLCCWSALYFHCHKYWTPTPHLNQIFY